MFIAAHFFSINTGSTKRAILHTKIGPRRYGEINLLTQWSFSENVVRTSCNRVQANGLGTLATQDNFSTDKNG